MGATPALAPLRFAAVPSHPAGRVDDLAVDGSTAVVMGEFELQWKDLKVPERPTYLAGLRFELPMRAIAATNGYAYLLTGGTRGDPYVGQLHVIDGREPSTPRVVGMLERTNWYNSDLVIHRGNAFLAAGVDGLQVVDVADPTAPRLRSSLALNGTAWSVTISSNRACVAVGGGFRMVDISTPDRPVVRGGLELGLLVFGGLASSGGEVYAAGGADGLFVIDVTQSAAPRELARLRFPGARAGAVSVEGGIAYVSTDSGVQVVDVSNPAVPVLRSTIPGAARATYVEGGRAYVCDVDLGFGGLRGDGFSGRRDVWAWRSRFDRRKDSPLRGIWPWWPIPSPACISLDLSRPAVPRYAGQVEMGGRAIAVAASAGRAYVSVEGGREQGELVIVDVANPVERR